MAPSVELTISDCRGGLSKSFEDAQILLRTTARDRFSARIPRTPTRDLVACIRRKAPPQLGGFTLRSHHAPHFFATATLVVLSGILTGLAAAGNIGPFALPGTTSQRPVSAQRPPTPLRADSLFPGPTPPPPSHEVVVVRDPAPPHVATPTPIFDQESQAPTAAPTSAPAPTPSACDDSCGGGGDG
jgi:hypothetical protein